MRAIHFCTLVTIVSLTLNNVGCAGAPFAMEKGWVDPSELAGRTVAVSQDTQAFTRFPSATAAGSIGNAPVPAKLPPTEPQPKPDPEPRADAPIPRQVIYSADFQVVVADVAGTLVVIREAAEKVGGHLQQVSGSTIVVRVPADHFQETVAVVEKAGEVTSRQLKTQDVTEEMLDLNIRLDNSTALLKRLQALLEKANKVEDAIKIESELARVAEQIDTVKGRMRYLNSQIAMSTIRVDLNAAVPQNVQTAGPRLPFDWVESLGEGLVAGQVQQSVKRVGIFGRGPKFQPPKGFVRYFVEENNVEAMDATGLRLRVQLHRNVDKAELKFWTKLVRKTLVESRSLAVTDEGGDANVYMITGTRDVGGHATGYMACIKRSDRNVAIFEAWGPADLFNGDVQMIRHAAVTVDPE